MQKFFLIFLFFGTTLLAQIPKGYCKPMKVEADPSSKSKLTIKFINPQGKPATSHVAFRINGDSLVQPEIDKTGTYVMKLNPGTYTFNFFVKYWYDVNSKPITLKPKTNTFITVKFEAVEIGSSPVK
ncbi:MAG TPA: hypothetical protein PLC65_12745 [Bacteroidia bacterium]|nr:hypothetical protein [Bacteroidia bacterium]HRD39494.1 hypothetical protein [Bacteroidia bacterium]